MNETNEAGIQAAIEAGKAAQGQQIGGGATGSEWIIRGEEESPEARFNRLVARLWSTSFRELPALVETLDMDQRRELGRHFEGLAQNAARVGAYLYMRGGNGYDQGHEKSVKEQNRVARKVRQAQGYHNTPDLNF